MLTSMLNIGSRLIPGPGQRPPRPQPSPKRTDPKTNLKSTVLFVGIYSFAARRGFFILF